MSCVLIINLNVFVTEAVVKSFVNFDFYVVLTELYNKVNIFVKCSFSIILCLFLCKTCECTSHLLWSFK